MILRRPILRDIAVRHGVTVATVSRALSGVAGVSDDLRAAISSTAKKLGYQADPTLSALAAYRRLQGTTGSRGLLMLIAVDEPVGTSSERFRRDLIEGANRRATQLGFDLAVESFGHGLVERIQARSPRGLLIASVGEKIEHLATSELPRVWIEMAGDDGCPGVFSDHSGNLRGALHQCSIRGYQRPGLIIPQWLAEGPGRDFMITYQVQLGTDAKQFITKDEMQFSHVGEWIRSNFIDVVINAGSGWPALELPRQGIAVPEECAVISLDLPNHEGEVAGYFQRRADLAAYAVDLLTSELACGHDDDKDCATLMLRGRWHDGRTLPKRSIQIIPQSSV